MASLCSSNETKSYRIRDNLVLISYQIAHHVPLIHHALATLLSFSNMLKLRHLHYLVLPARMLCYYLIIEFHLIIASLKSHPQI